MTRREDMIAGAFELAGWGVAGIAIAVFFLCALPFWIAGWGMYRLGVIK